MEHVKIEYLTPVIELMEMVDILTASKTAEDIIPGDTDLPPIDW
jgi:hypothetical protein